MTNHSRRQVLQAMLAATAVSLVVPVAASAANPPDPFVPSDLALEWWSRFISLSTEDKRRYAEILRETDARFDRMAGAIDAYVKHEQDNLSHFA